MIITPPPLIFFLFFVVVFVYTCGGGAGNVLEADGLGEARTVRHPIASGNDAVHALLGVDLLAKSGDACVCHECRVERDHAVPRRISRVRAVAPPCRCVSGQANKDMRAKAGGSTFARSIPPRGIAWRGRTRILL